MSQLKQDASTRHIPVQIVTLDEDRHHGLARGAFAFVQKPTTTEALESAFARIKGYAKSRRKRLLLVEDNAAERRDHGHVQPLPPALQAALRRRGGLHHLQFHVNSSSRLRTWNRRAEPIETASSSTTP